MTNKDTPLINRPIPGVTWRVIALIILAVGTVVLLYTRLEYLTHSSLDQTIKNGKTLIEIQAENKEYRTLNEVRLNQIEIEQRELRVRLEILENKLK